MGGPPDNKEWSLRYREGPHSRPGSPSAIHPGYDLVVDMSIDLVQVVESLGLLWSQGLRNVSPQ